MHLFILNKQKSNTSLLNLEQLEVNYLNVYLKEESLQRKMQ